MERERQVPAVLNGWKEIGDYLGKSVRTVQRWERDLKLPVHRVAGSTSYSVYAVPSEVDAWLRDNREQLEPSSAPAATNEPPDVALPAPLTPIAADGMHRRRSTYRAAAIAAGVLFAIVLAGFVVTPQRGMPRQIRISSATSLQGPQHVFLVVSGTLLLVDAPTQQILDRFVPAETEGFRSFVSGTVSADGRYLVLTTDVSGVIVFDMVEQRFAPWIQIPDRRIARARLTTDNRKLLVPDQLGRLLVLDADTGVEQARVSVPPQVFDSLSDRADKRFFVPSRDAGFLNLIEAATLTITRRIPTGDGPHDLATNSDVSLGYVTNEYAGTVSCMDISEGTLVSTVRVGAGPQSVAVSGDDNTVYVSNTKDRSVSAIDSVSCEVITTIERAAGGERTGAVGTTRDSRIVIVAGFDGKGVWFVDVSTPARKLLGRIPTIDAVSTIARAPVRSATVRASDNR